MTKQHNYAKVSGIALAALLAAFPAAGRAQDEAKNFSPQQIQTGAKIYAQTCAPCHGVHMADPEGAFDLRKFPRDQHGRFIASVSKGKNSMPPWGGLYTPEEIESLWAYVVAGEKQ
jgi:mono/diheme cytochrome c family protein